MKRATITINEDGSTEIDLKEGFSGMSCIEKSKLSLMSDEDASAATLSVYFEGRNEIS